MSSGKEILMFSSVKSLLQVAVDLIMVVPSPDGILTAAALLKLTGKQDIKVLLVSPGRLDNIQINTWKPDSNIVMVNLGVDRNNPKGTREFLDRIQAAGHAVVAIVDHHNSSDWKKVLGDEGLANLFIQPQEKSSGFSSSGAVLLHALGEEDIDPHTRELLEAADRADQGDYSPRLAKLVNEVIKPSPNSDIRRRWTLIRHLAKDTQPSPEIAAWASEYQDILAHHEEVLGARQELGHGIVLVDIAGGKVDRNVLKRRLYQMGYVAVVMINTPYSNLDRYRVGVYSEALDLKAICEEAAVPCEERRTRSISLRGEHKDKIISALLAHLSVADGGQELHACA